LQTSEDTLISFCYKNHPERKLANVSCANHPERKLANMSSCTNHPETKLAIQKGIAPMRDGDFGDDNRFTDVQMLMEFRCADHG